MPVANALLSERLKVTHYDFDPDVTTAVDVAWVDMQDADRILMSFFRTVGTSDITLQVLGNSASNGSGTDVVIKSKTNAEFGDPDAVGDYAFIEVSADELVAASESGCRYVSLNLAFATGTDEGVVTYVKEMKTGKASQSANSIA
jgi:hypothetical protein